MGCGVGLPTILALSRGASVLATDHYEAALDFTIYNASTNVDLKPEVSELDWRQPSMQSLGTFDLVLAADVLYERKNVAALADLVPKLLAPGGEPMFLKAMEERGFEDTIEDAMVEQGTRTVEVLLHRLRR